ncbi:BRCT domain-containing protein [Mycena filopes]|nr:BRCT domain-containing protein [Mycena filopes]
MKSGKGHAKVLCPTWFDDSLTLGFRTLSTDAYGWYTMPNVGRERQSTRSLQLLEYPSDVWGGRRILLGTGLKLTTSRRLIVEDGIRRCGGTVVEYMANGGAGALYEELAHIRNMRCDVFITCHRDGASFSQAWDKELTIGTLRWLLEMQATGIYSGPRDRLLNFPHPSSQVKGIKDTIICLSPHYDSEAAEYLRRLVKLMGGVSTNNLEAKITVVVAAHPRSKLTAKAVEASIPIVNHTWLEDCFIEWELLDTTLPKYTLFPADVEFGALGERGIGHEIERLVGAQQKGYYFGYH